MYKSDAIHFAKLTFASNLCSYGGLSRLCSSQVLVLGIDLPVVKRIDVDDRSGTGLAFIFSFAML